MTLDSARQAFARSLSVVGHPAVLMPCAVVGSAWFNGAPWSIVLAATGATLLVALSVGLFSIAQVRRGRWRHVDASMPRERSQLNRVLACVMFGVAGALWAAGEPPFIAGALASGGAIVVFGHLVRRWLKVSLHVAFAVFAACLMWGQPVALVGGLALASGVGWSRLALGRHTMVEVVMGVLAGGAAGGCFVWLAS